MKILVLGGTRYFGKYMTEKLIGMGHDVTIATRGLTADRFGNRVKRIIVDRLSRESMRAVFEGAYYDIVYDKLAYCSDDVANALDFIGCGRYIFMSSSAVYEEKRMEITENAFDPADKPYIMCRRCDLSYGAAKREAERILVRKYGSISSVIVRYPVVLGADDYTGRLRFYVEHIMKKIPMNIDNINAECCYIGAEEAGDFLAFLADKDCRGIINGSASGTVSPAEIIAYTERKCGEKAVLSAEGDSAPYNGESSFSLDTSSAERLGYRFSELKDWIYKLLDFYIDA